MRLQQGRWPMSSHRCPASHNLKNNTFTGHQWLPKVKAELVHIKTLLAHVLNQNFIDQVKSQSSIHVIMDLMMVLALGVLNLKSIQKPYLLRFKGGPTSHIKREQSRRGIFLSTRSLFFIFLIKISNRVQRRGISHQAN